MTMTLAEARAERDRLAANAPKLVDDEGRPTPLAAVIDLDREDAVRVLDEALILAKLNPDPRMRAGEAAATADRLLVADPDDRVGRAWLDLADWFARNLCQRS